MAMEIINTYGGYAAQGMAGSSAVSGTKRKETGKTQETAESSKAKSTAGYANELAKLVPSVEFRVGNACVSDKSGKSLTVNPKLLEQMQNDPEKEKDMKDMIKGVESMSKLAESIAKASGWTIVYQHSYIDENGKYHCRMQTRNDFMLNMSDKLREERRKNSEKLIEKTKEKAVEKKEELEETLEERRTEKEEEVPVEKAAEEAAEKEEKVPAEKTAEEAAGKTEKESVYGRAEQLFNEKMAASKDGIIYLNETDLRILIEAAQEEGGAGRTGAKGQVQAGANLDLRI